MIPCLGLALGVFLAPARGGTDQIVVFAAASLADALEEIGRGWQAESGPTVLFNFGASSDLGRQARAGAPADVFLSADREQMDLLERAGLVRAPDRVELLSNTLVVVVPAGSPGRIRAPADLLAVRRLALADPEAVPAGVYARRWLVSLGLWDGLRARVVPVLNVRAALSAVESSNADAAVVYRTDAALSRRARVAFEVAREQGPPIVYVVAPLAGSTTPAARAFVRHLVAPAARAVFEKHGFLTLGGR
ncbi:MAG TPA: molybdate ABC transporter substrate-binding protein [Vicinamibacteria bacterium]|nr:molybdate ABC transporter substrate-binding protein [Vicinamibacteria bacterium]